MNLTDKRRGQLAGAGAIIPLVISLSIAAVVLVGVAIPVINASSFNGTASTWTGTTANIASAFMPLTAVVLIVIIAAAIMALAGHRE